jgi:hypothetical protein
VPLTGIAKIESVFASVGWRSQGKGKCRMAWLELCVADGVELIMALEK